MNSAASTSSTPAVILRSKLQTGTAIAGIIGLGYVGLPLAHALHVGGLRVMGFDIDQSKIDSLKKGTNYLKHFGDDMAKELGTSDRFTATTEFARLSEPDVLIVCLPTPLGRHHEPDLSYVVSCGEQIGCTLRSGQLIVLESTTYPGTTREDFLEAIRRGAMGTPAEHFVVGKDYFVAFSPEREDPGRKSHTTRTIPKLVGGLDDRSTELACALYRYGVENVVPVRSAEIAEAAKLLENIFRCVNIALVNEMKIVLDAMGIDVWEVIEASSTKPFGFMPFYPGPGLGGHCIPIDPFYLTWKAKEVGHPTRFIELAGEINTRMPHYVIERMMAAFNERGKALKGAKILVLGLAYKPDIDDTRESPSFELISLLRERGAEVSYSDPFVPKTVPVRKHDLAMTSVEITQKNIASFDAVLISTNHSAFDYEVIAEDAKLVIDTRNAMKNFAARMGSRLVKA